MEVNCFQILLIDVAFYLSHVSKVVLNVLIKNENPNICGTGGKRVNTHFNPNNCDFNLLIKPVLKDYIRPKRLNG